MDSVLSPLEIDLDGLDATAALGRAIARRLRPGDVLALAGALGSGKTTLVRAIVRAFGETEEDVPSPTFTLAQTYPFAGFTLWHFDLYRLERPEDAYELGIEEAFADGVAVIEWPERLGPLLPAARLEIALDFGAAVEARHARLTGRGDWAGRLAGLGREVGGG